MTEQKEFTHWLAEVLQDYLKKLENTKKELDNSSNPSIHCDTEVKNDE